MLPPLRFIPFCLARKEVGELEWASVSLFLHQPQRPVAHMARFGLFQESVWMQKGDSGESTLIPGAAAEGM